MHTKSVDLLDLSPHTDVDVLAQVIIRQESLISQRRQPQLRAMLIKLTTKLSEEFRSFSLFKVLQAHILPLTNCAFDKSGRLFITSRCVCRLPISPEVCFNLFVIAVRSSHDHVIRTSHSYDKSCKVWATSSGRQLLKLEGHKNVVYAIALNNPYGDKIVTGSFDKTCKLWCSQSGALLHTLEDHDREVVCVAFNPQGSMVASGSTDNTAKLWSVQDGELLYTLGLHDAEIVSLFFNTTGTQIVTGSFDRTARIWDAGSGECIHVLEGHKGVS
jgi:dynein assembly factor with WDR repeat domains 1